jgi:DNA-binding response OmpR family regulator
VPPLSRDRKQRLLTIRRNGSSQCLDLTKGETAVLTALMNHPGQVLSCEALVSEAFDYEADDFEAKSIIRPCIRRLRQKIEANPAEPLLISTVRRRGYRLNPAESA